MILGMFARLFWPCFSELHRSERKACCRATAPRPESGLGFKFCSKHNSEPELQKGFFFFFFFLQTGQMDNSKNWEALHFRLRFLMLLNKTTTFFTSTSTDVVVLYYLEKKYFYDQAYGSFSSCNRNRNTKKYLQYLRQQGQLRKQPMDGGNQQIWAVNIKQIDSWKCPQQQATLIKLRWFDWSRIQS